MTGGVIGVMKAVLLCSVEVRESDFGGLGGVKGFRDFYISMGVLWGVETGCGLF